MIISNAHAKIYVSAFDSIQILCLEDSINGVGPSVICTRTLVSMKFCDYLPHTEISHLFLSLLPSNIRIPIR
jgi:hypothetical protein